MTSSLGVVTHQATLEEEVILLNGQTSSSLTGRTCGLPSGQPYVQTARPVRKCPDRRSSGFFHGDGEYAPENAGIRTIVSRSKNDPAKRSPVN